MTRAREAGIPPLNDVRRQIHAETNDAQLAPYTSWADFGQHLKHPESLINFVAAYGTHPSITSESTIAGKRAAAKLIVDPADPLDPAIPADAADFMFSNGRPGPTTPTASPPPAWTRSTSGSAASPRSPTSSAASWAARSTTCSRPSSRSCRTATGFYYLARTPGMNLRTQLEGNSFSELIQRNTDDTNTLKADAFATADCKFQLANLEGTAAGYALHGFLVADDPSTPDCDESLLLMRHPDGTIAVPLAQHGRPVRHQRPVGLPGHSRRRPRHRRQRQRHLLGCRRQRHHRRQRRRRRRSRWRGQRHHHRPRRRSTCSRAGPATTPSTPAPATTSSMGGDGQDFINGGANDNEIVRRSRQRLRHRRSGCRRRVRRQRRRLDRRRIRSGPPAGRPRRAVLRRPGAGRARQRQS